MWAQLDSGSVQISVSPLETSFFEVLHCSPLGLTNCIEIAYPPQSLELQVDNAMAVTATGRVVHDL